MEDLIIPGWAVVLMATLGGGGIYWLIWLTIKTFENDKSIAINNNNDTNVGQELHKINSKIEKMDDKMDRIMDQIMKITK